MIHLPVPNEQQSGQVGPAMVIRDHIPMNGMFKKEASKVAEG